MLIDCATCIAPRHACRDCVVTVLLDSPPATAAAGEPLRAAVELDDAERGALAELSAAGLVPPLRLIAGAQADAAQPDAGARPGAAALPDADAPRRRVRGIA